ncbi:MAG: undecaprenyl-diphosphatase UppP [Candidatus Omnitrophota bacterium]|nr:undecaprenyl-diphosphatase UppP [Candidatus Omnitrophota bacterium]
MSIFESIILGIVQGVGEFLPISSSAHLIIVPYLLNLKPHSLTFDVALHLGTLCAIGAYFFKDWLKLFKEGFLSLKLRTLQGAPERRLFWFIFIATIPGALAGKLLEEKVETVFRNPLLAASVLGGFAFILYLAQKLGKNTRFLGDMKLKQAFLIGVVQSFALLPGISRSGATMAAGLALNFKKEEAVKFSFLLSFPIILGAGLLKIKDIFSCFLNGEAKAFLAGFIASAFFGLLSIHFLLKFIRKYSFNLFIWYRIIVCVLVAAVVMLRSRG